MLRDAISRSTTETGLLNSLICIRGAWSLMIRLNLQPQQHFFTSANRINLAACTSRDHPIEEA
jgi:hypothetical protein